LVTELAEVKTVRPFLLKSNGIAKIQIIIFNFEHNFKFKKMKKLLFSLAFLAGFVSLIHAQNVIWSDDFDDADVSDWMLYDEDGDGYYFEASDLDADGYYSLSSASYINGIGALTPDNWAVTPAIDISGYSSLSLDYFVGGQDPSWSSEVYTIYASTGNTLDDFLNSSVSFTENLGDDPNAAGMLVERTLDLSSFVGEQTVYIAIRHHDVTDQYWINFDDFSLTGEMLGVSDLNANISSVYPNPVVDTFTVNLSDKFNANNVSVTITDLTGKMVKSFANQTEYNISGLPKGVYVVKITDGKNTETKKIVKK
jgi:hypothetical protein